MKRHVDDSRDAYVHVESEPVCSECGNRWTEGEDAPHNGGCCGADDKIRLLHEHCDDEESECYSDGSGCECVCEGCTRMKTAPIAGHYEPRRPSPMFLKLKEMRAALETLKARGFLACTVSPPCGACTVCNAAALVPNVEDKTNAP